MADGDTLGAVFVGCAGLPERMTREHYYEQLSYVEVDTTFHSLPKQKVLNRWRGPDAAHGFGIVAWQAITHPPGRDGYPRCDTPLTAEELREAGEYRDTPFIRRAVERLAGAAQTAGANTVVFRTPATWAPSAANRARLQRFFTEIAPADLFGDCQRVWQPDGLWDLETALNVATSLDQVLVACDPISADPLAPSPEQFLVLAELLAGKSYFRSTGLGRSRPLGEHPREILLLLVEQFQRVWLVFDSPTKYRDARSVYKELRKRTSPEE